MWLIVTTYPAPPTSKYGPVKVMRPGLATACWYLHNKSHRQKVISNQFIIYH